MAVQKYIRRRAMRFIFGLCVFVLLPACGGSSQNNASVHEADNPATRYVDNLRQDEKMAQSAVDRYNRSVHQEEAAGHQAGEAGGQ
jgi:hypothetical protein